MTDFLMKSKIDFAFKEIMMDEKARIGFLSAVLKIKPEEIKETQILNTNLRKEHDDKQGILDVRLLMNNDAERKEVFDMLVNKNPYIDSAYQKLQIISQDKEKRLEYEAREKAIRDYNEGLREAEERGIAIGQEQGIAIGQEQGIERLNKLNMILLQNKRYDDLERSANDTDFQQQLMREYDI
ncbi:MAG: hypothetical protein HFI71_13745 [Lachnospiraceae bacterium]|nr:hypothetical protein [Lachnospiraceae bacterium]